MEALRYRWYTVEKAVSSRLRLSGSLLEAAKLCVLIDWEFTPSIVHSLIESAVSIIQLRIKGLTDRAIYARALHLREFINSSESQNECILIINDRPDIAAAANADGVHLRQDDLPVKVAREILGPRQTDRRLDAQHRTSPPGRARWRENYIGVGPTFPSKTKLFATFPGTALLKQIADEMSLPAFAIGGITLENLDEVLATGIKRVAVAARLRRQSGRARWQRRFHRDSNGLNAEFAELSQRTRS